MNYLRKLIVIILSLSMINTAFAEQKFQYKINNLVQEFSQDIETHFGGEVQIINKDGSLFSLDSFIEDSQQSKIEKTFILKIEEEVLKFDFRMLQNQSLGGDPKFDLGIRTSLMNDSEEIRLSTDRLTLDFSKDSELLNLELEALTSSIQKSYMNTFRNKEKDPKWQGFIENTLRKFAKLISILLHVLCVIAAIIFIISFMSLAERTSGDVFGVLIITGLTGVLSFAVLNAFFY